MSLARELPAPESTALRHMLCKRRSIRDFAQRPLTVAQIGAALWCAVGEVSPGRTTTPSARATHLLRATLVAGSVEGLPPGAYRYDAADHSLVEARGGDNRQLVANVTIDATAWLGGVPAHILLSVAWPDAEEEFRDQPVEHSHNFMWIEAGHAIQNLYLWATQDDLGVVEIAGFDENRLPSIREVLPEGHELLSVVAIGHRGNSA